MSDENKLPRYLVRLKGDRQNMTTEELDKASGRLWPYLEAVCDSSDELDEHVDFMPYGVLLFKCSDNAAALLRERNSVEAVAKAESPAQCDDFIYASMRLSLDEVAEVLNVSQEYVLGLLDQGRLPYYTTVDDVRRVLYEDIQKYREQREAERDAAMDELVQQAQELNLGY